MAAQVVQMPIGGAALDIAVESFPEEGITTVFAWCQFGNVKLFSRTHHAGDGLLSVEGAENEAINDIVEHLLRTTK